MLLTSVLHIILTRSFSPFVFKSGFENCLDFEALDGLGLYVHIPFCKSLCSFCPYCKEIYDKDRADSYKTALLKEIDLVCRNMSNQKEVTSLYFGGGTPALMIDDLAEIIDRLKRYFIISGEIGVELHPQNITEEIIDKLLSAGVTMVSIGVQSFDEQSLLKLGRTSNSLTDRLLKIKNKGFQVVDVDLIFAIPGQTEDILISDIKTAFENGATQVSTYPFVDFTFAKNKYKPLPEKEKKKMLETLARYCHDYNLDRTSVWTFAKHNTGKYSSITRDAFLGFGVSSTTLLKDKFKINTHSIEAYIERVNKEFLPTSLTLDFSLGQRMAYFLFWSSYAMKINKEKFAESFGRQIKTMFGLEFKIAERLGYIRENCESYELTGKGATLFHSIEQAYTRAYIDKMWNISKQQAFPEQIILK
ncbi:MAG: radical SAM protein [Bacillota bacterium]|nr:radical SAM protein [Bacillota bacterium]